MLVRKSLAGLGERSIAESGVARLFVGVEGVVMGVEPREQSMDSVIGRTRGMSAGDVGQVTQTSYTDKRYGHDTMCGQGKWMSKVSSYTYSPSSNTSASVRQSTCTTVASRLSEDG